MLWPGGHHPCSPFIKSECFVADYFVHHPVVVVDGYLLHALEVKAYADLVGPWHLCQEAVVVSASASEAVPLVVEAHARNDDQLDAVEVAVRLSDGFEQVVDAFGEVVRSRILPRFDMFFVDTFRQDDGLALLEQCVDEMPCVHLVGQCVVEHHHAGSLQAWVAEQLLLDLFRPSLTLLSGVLLFPLPDGLSELLF